MAMCLSGGAWLLGAVIALVPVLVPGWQIYSINSMCVGLPLTTDHYNGKSYSIAVFIILNFVLFILIALGQYFIVKAKASTNEKSTILTKIIAEKRFKDDMAMAKKLSVIVISDFLCWFPIGIMGVMSLTGTAVSEDAYVLSAIFIVPINSAINPLLYTLPTVKAKLREFAAVCFKTNVE